MNFFNEHILDNNTHQSAEKYVHMYETYKVI